MKFKRIAIDTSKHVFTLHGVDEQERPILRRELKRGRQRLRLIRLGDRPNHALGDARQRERNRSEGQEVQVFFRVRQAVASSALRA